ncbi:hypothetical protein [Brevundimonas sp.]|uniref:hypothetical protein n=1 Tax=Brevundimonas sp. TaxID=1871086 RepID=UPI0028A79A6B|nr:hypothetical protein [Brevundimonas sp.]
MIMINHFRIAALAMALTLPPMTAMASSLIDIHASRKSAESSPVAVRRDVFPGAIHWALLAAGVAFVGVSIYIQRRRGFDFD